MTLEPERRIKLLADMVSPHPKPVARLAKHSVVKPVVNAEGGVMVNVDGVTWRLLSKDFEWVPLPGKPLSEVLEAMDAFLRGGDGKRVRVVTPGSLLHQQLQEALNTDAKMG